MKNAERPFTLVLGGMETAMYDRSWEQNEELGLKDIKVENYSPDS